MLDKVFHLLTEEFQRKQGRKLEKQRELFEIKFKFKNSGELEN